MRVHKGCHINNVQSITGVRIAEMSQLQNCSFMCTKNGSYCENVKRREKVRGMGGCVQRMEVIVKRKKSGGQGRCERRSEAFVKIQFFFFFFFFGGGGGSGLGWGVRVDVNGEVKLL